MNNTLLIRYSIVEYSSFLYYTTFKKVGSVALHCYTINLFQGVQSNSIVD
jgi:hypothetical protein